jgi:hypothetical protein
MPDPELLLNRLNQIGESLSKIDTSLALIGLGSVGVDLERLDRFSDLDFFVIVESGSKDPYLENLDWLTSVAPVAYYFQNTPDGYKLLYEDGVFCEFAVFDEEELKEAAFSPGRMIWKVKGVDETIKIPQRSSDKTQYHSTEWLVGEVLTNLYVGLSRDKRGEQLAAMRFIQGHAVDRLLELSERIEESKGVDRDPFSIERRFEERFPTMAKHLPELLGGYNSNRQSALATLSYLDHHFELNIRMKEEILRLCE